MLTTPIYQNPLAYLCFSSHLLHLLNLSPISPLLKAHFPLCPYDRSCASLLFLAPTPSLQSLPYPTTTESSLSSPTLCTSIQSQAFNPSIFPPVYFRLFISFCFFPSIYFFLFISSCLFPPVYFLLFISLCLFPPISFLSFISLSFIPSCLLPPIYFPLFISLCLFLLCLFLRCNPFHTLETFCQSGVLSIKQTFV